MSFKRTKKLGKNFIGSVKGDLNDIGNQFKSKLGSLENFANSFDQRIAGGLEDVLQGLTGVRISNIPEISAEVVKVKEKNREARAQVLNEVKGDTEKGSARETLVYPESFFNERGEVSNMTNYIYFRCLERKNAEPGEVLPNILLYLPDAIVDNMAVTYSEGEMGLKESVVAKLTGATQNFGIDGAIFKQILAETAGGAVVKQNAGATINPLKFQTFESVPFRTFSYSFTLRPKSVKENQTIIDIIYYFKKMTLPGVTGTNNRIYTFPNEWAIKFIGPVKNYIDFPLSAVCTGVDVDYGGGQPFANMIDGGPSAYTLTVNFTETTTIDRKKFDEQISAKTGGNLNSANERFKMGQFDTQDPPSAESVEQADGSGRADDSGSNNQTSKSTNRGTPRSRRGRTTRFGGV